MMDHLYDKFQENGFVIIENFLTDEEVQRLKKAGCELAENIPPETQKTVFNTTLTPHNKDSYFVESGDKIRYFYEKDALNPEGELVVDPSLALNKVGHALHWLHPDFKEISFSSKVATLCRSLKLDSPLILQNFRLVGHWGVGKFQIWPVATLAGIVSHQDSNYLYTEPNTLVGLWFPLDDATIENGCLWFIAGSHQSGVHRRFIRNPDPTSEELLIYDRPQVTYPSSGFIPYPTPKGSCVVIHGNVVHKSDDNKSDKSRHAYTFHVMDATSTYSPQNWLQSTKGFPLIYSN